MKPRGCREGVKASVESFNKGPTSLSVLGSLLCQRYFPSLPNLWNSGKQARTHTW